MTRIPDLTRLADPSWSPVYSDIFNYLSKTCCLCYSIFDLLIKQKHFSSGNPMTIYNFKTPITFTFNIMHLQNDAFIQYQCNVKILLQIHFSIPSFRCSVCDSTYNYRIRHPRQIQLVNPACLSFSSNVVSHSILPSHIWL